MKKVRGKKIYKIVDKYFGGVLIFFISLFRRKHKVQTDNIKSILIIKFSALGDTILFLPLIKKLIYEYSEIKIDFLCSSINIPVVNTINDLLTNIFVINPYEILHKPIIVIKQILKLRKNYYDIILDGGQWVRFNPILIWTLKYNISIGFDTKGQYRHFLYDYSIKHQRNIHEIDNFFNLLKPLNIYSENEDKHLFFNIDNINIKKGDIFSNNRKRIVIHPGCGYHGSRREWGYKNYIELIKRIIKEYPKCLILLSGSEYEKELTQKIKSGVVSDNVVNIAGKYSFAEIAKVLSYCNILISGNTGIMHLGAALNIKQLVLIGPTDNNIWGPLNNKAHVIKSTAYCSPCLYLGFEYKCKKSFCMDLITVNEVYKAFNRIVIS